MVSYEEKQKRMVALFADCPNEGAKYEKLIALGKTLPKLSIEEKSPSNLVKGCQSTMYLHSELSGNTILFKAESDALISAGLAALLIEVYSGETMEVVLASPPDYIETLGIRTSLTPSRANGLYSIHLRMRQDALRFLMEKKKAG